MIPAGSVRLVRRNVPIDGGTVAAISAIESSLITPGPLGMLDTNPRAAAPSSTAMRASSIELMQQILTRVMSSSLELRTTLEMFGQ
jgi:hypothetical protein